jgi:peptidyl-prolyl cis-trans isomerase D
VLESRDFTWVLLDEDTLETPVAAPDEATLRAYFDANAETFVLSATKKLTYAWLNPTDIIDQVELPEEDLRAEYDARADQYNQPERRLVERLVFADQASADQAAAALEVNGTSFEALVEDRGLALADVDMGDVAQSDLGAAGEVVFGAASGSIAGPAPTDLGPALFRINGVLPAQLTTFEQAEPELRDALASDRAIRLVEGLAEDFDNRLAGGSTVEQLAEQTDMVLGQIDWTAETSEGIAAYGSFREIAATVTKDDFPKIEQLEDGGIFALRLDEELPERPATYADVSADVAIRWRTDEIVTQLRAKAEAARQAAENGTTWPEQGLTQVVEPDQTRNAFVTGTPAGFMSEIFEMEVGEIRILEGTDTVVLMQLDAVNAAGDTPEAQALIAQLRTQQNEELARGLFDIYTEDTLLRAGQNIDPRAVNAVNASLQ